MKIITRLLLALCALDGADQAGRILRPVDKASLPDGSVDIVATAPEGRLEIDGKPVPIERPFPNVLHAKTTVTPGEHELALIWEDSRTAIRFFAGPKAPAEFAAFRHHPPVQDVKCTQCHELSQRGRFRFKGGDACADCHPATGFVKVHTHLPEVLTQCGLCHNAHGSTSKAHLLYSKEIACKQCHN